MTGLTPRQRRLTVSVEEAAALLGVSRGYAYEQIKVGSFPVPAIRIGARIVIPIHEVARVLGTDAAGVLDRLGRS